MKLFPEILLGFAACLTASVCEAQQTLRVMEYNVENLFDCRHDSLKNDSEYFLIPFGDGAGNVIMKN